MLKSCSKPISASTALPKINIAWRGVYSVFSDLNIFKKLRKLIVYKHLRRICSPIFSPVFARKGDWHTSCFTSSYQPSITVKPVTKKVARLIRN